MKALTLCFSRETVTIVNNLGLSAEQRGDARQIVQAITLYVAGQLNESVERRNFCRRCQQPGESFDDLLVSLRELAKTCKFCSEACTEKNLRDQIIEGLSDGDIVETLLREKDLTLETMITKCRAQEAAEKQRAEMVGGNPQVDAAHQGLSTLFPPDKLCPGCGSAPHSGGRQQCPAYKLTCHFCKKPGHLARVCKRRRPRPFALAVHTEPSPEQDLPQVNASHTPVRSMFEPAPKIEVCICSLNGETTVAALPSRPILGCLSS